MKGRQGIIPGYNAQAMASPVVQSSGNGMLITAADVVNSAADSGQLVPMLEQAEEMIGESVPVTLADGGYHTAANLAAGEQRGDLFVMPERYHPGYRVPSSKISSSMILPLTLTSVLRDSVYPFGDCAGKTERFRDRSEFTGPQGLCAALARPTVFAPKTYIPGARYGSAPLMRCSASTGIG